MDIDYGYIKKVLTVIKEDHKDYSPIEDIKRILDEHELDIDKFHYHLLLLMDNNVVEIIPDDYCWSDGGDDTDCASIYYNDEISLIRLTYDGHQFLDILNNNKIMKKVKKLTVDKAMQIGTSIAFEAVKSYLLNQ